LLTGKGSVLEESTSRLDLDRLAQEVSKIDEMQHEKTSIFCMLSVIECLPSKRVFWRRGIVTCPEAEVGNAVGHIVVCASLDLAESDSSCN
jgi:hypothetical protein